ncbi:hypothetical protein NW94_03160 [Burkholderia mallei]|nr:hypothetical protein NW94_03160 [Burkholderia mallei]
MRAAKGGMRAVRAKRHRGEIEPTRAWARRMLGRLYPAWMAASGAWRRAEVPPRTSRWPPMLRIPDMSSRRPAARVGVRYASTRIDAGVV